jgi:hypothetical protein
MNPIITYQKPKGKVNPCPFCDGTDLSIRIETLEFLCASPACMISVFCNDCCAQGPMALTGSRYKSYDGAKREATRKAIQDWNRR